MYAIRSYYDVQLLRSSSQAPEKGRQLSQRGLYEVGLGVGTGDGHRRLTGMAGLFRHGLEHQRSAGDGLMVFVEINQTDKKGPASCKPER